MELPDTCNAAYAALRNLAFRDPKQTRLYVCHLIDSNPPYLHQLLDRLSLPGEGRLRHVVANAVRARPHKELVVAHLIEWQATETDEFARRAISAALEGVDRTSFQQPPREAVIDPQIVVGYRYAFERITHKFRNALEEPQAKIIRLRTRIQTIADPELRVDLTDLLVRLQDGFDRVGRVVEFNPDDDWFRIRSVHLEQWLSQMNQTYALQFRAIALEILPAELSRQVRVRASDHLLETIFWNLWKNAQQEVGEGCKITVKLTAQGGIIHLTILDNGTGFDSGSEGVAFCERFSTRGAAHGRGLLEVQAAMDELQGAAAIRCQNTGDYRVRLSFPMEQL